MSGYQVAILVLARGNSQTSAAERGLSGRTAVSIGWVAKAVISLCSQGGKTAWEMGSDFELRFLEEGIVPVPRLVSIG